ncbi:MAG: hypothetical protein KKF65_00760 [Nanoarchaeota archaeon]|nr:hypothetical protein [Nanoarchaeota archaeon]
MVELLEVLKKERLVEQICKEHSLNVAMLVPIFENWMRGYNNNVVAQKIGVHRVTVQRYAAALKELTESDFILIKEYVLHKILEEKR